MKRKELLNLDDFTLDKKVIIQGTQWDRKRKLSDKDLKKIVKLLKRGYNYEKLGEMYRVTPHCIRYNTDEEYRRHAISIRSGKHTGIDVYTFKNRVDYKRLLVKKRKIRVKDII